MAIENGLHCVREKYWHEKSADEKIEAVGRAVEELSQLVKRTVEITDELSRHSHAIDGRIVVEFNRATTLALYFLENPLARERK